MAYNGPGKFARETRSQPAVQVPGDVVVKITKRTICGTDLYIRGVGVDCAMKAVGVPATFELCQQIVAPGGVIANIGVHGVPASLFLYKLWDRNVSSTTRLVDTVSTPMLLKTVCA